MHGKNLFDLYRQLLAISVGSYALVRLVHFIWRFQVATRSAPRLEALGRRYLVLQLIRVRIHRFALDLVQIAAAAAVLGYVLWLHGR